MGRVYRMVGCHRDGDAVYLLMDQYDYLQTRAQEFEALLLHDTCTPSERCGPNSLIV